MGKRSDFIRNPRDLYPTPGAAVKPLLPWVCGDFIEPCAAAGQLVGHLQRAGLTCKGASDIEPGAQWVLKLDALKHPPTIYPIITNTPWRVDIMHPMIEHFVNIAPFVWLLIYSDWAFTKQSAPYMKMCSHMIAIGRIKWIEGSKGVGKDNCAWYRFSRDATHTQFIGR